MFIIERSHIILLLLIFAITGSQSCETNLFPGISLPIHPNAISANRMTDRPVKGVKAVFYRVPIEFPGTKLIDFYKRELAAIGYVPFNNAIESRPSGLWSKFNNKSGEFEKTTMPPACYIASWADKAKETWIWLYISYEYDAKNPAWRSNAIVSCNMAKYSTYEEGLRKIKSFTE